MAESILYTNGDAPSLTIAQFEAYDAIRYSAAQPAQSVSLQVTDAGRLNLAGELGTISATITADAAITLTSGGGDDHLTGSGRSDTLNGGAGDDTLKGDDGRDVLNGGAGDDDLRGGTGVDTLNGGAGDDRLNGGAGNDVLFGGAGNDTFVVSGTSSGRDVFHGGAGSGDTLRIDSDFRTSALVLTSRSGLEVLDLNALDDRALLGTDGADTIVLSGIVRYADEGSGGFNAIRLGAGNDNFTGTQADDAVYGGTGNDRLRGGNGDDLLNGGNGNDTLSGGAGDDTFLISGGSSGRDLLRGGAGTDTLATTDDAALKSLSLNRSAGIEQLDIDAAGGRALSGSQSADVFNLSGVSSYVEHDGLYNAIHLNAGNDVFTGSSTDDLVFGDAGADTLRGGAGDDVLIGGGGNDALVGGAGADTFRFVVAPNGTSNTDSLSDFTSGTDRIELDRDVFTAVAAGALDAAAFGTGATATTADQRVLYDAGTGRLYYDADGTGDTAAVWFAQVGAGTTVTASDFFGV